MQLMQPQLLPSAIEPMVNKYGECIFPVVNSLVADVRRKLTSKRINQALASCATVKTATIASADAALANAPIFADEPYRKAYIKERFDSLDNLVRDMALGRNDPDDRKSNAPNN